MVILRETSLGVVIAVAAAWPGVTPVAAVSGLGPISQVEGLVLDPEVVSFDEVDLGETVERTITATNTGTEPIPIGSVVLQGDPFANAGDSCHDETLPVGESCEVHVTFTPTATGEFMGAVQFVTASGTAMADLVGVGTPASSTSSTTSPPSTEPPGTTSPTATSPPSTAPPTTPTTTLSDQLRLADCERRAHDATVRFAPALDMTVGETEQFVVVASTETSPTSISESTSTTVVPVPLRCEVQAQLRGRDFDIDPEEFQPGSFLDRPTITWLWDIAARQAGESTLTLEIRSIAVIDGRRIEGAGGELYTSTIHIDARPENFWSRSKRWSGEIVDHPLVRGLGSLLLVGGTIAAAWRWLLKRPWPWASSEAIVSETTGRTRRASRRRTSRNSHD